MSQATTTADKQESAEPLPPEVIQGDNLTARILRQKVWRAVNVHNDWFMAVLVGREGSGKSHTALSIMEKCDPSFSADRVHFEPDELLEQINNIPADDRQGKAIMLDESGVGMGARTWWDEGQIAFNKALQTARDDNMIVILTLPRLAELDSQMRGRLHAFLEMTELVAGEHARFKWKNVSPTRDERDHIYKKYPKMRVNGRTTKITSIALGPPSDGLAADYEEQKEAFKAALYQDTVDTIRGEDGEEERTPKDVATDIIDDGRIEEFVDEHGGNGMKFISKDKLQLEFSELSVRGAKQAKIVLEEEWEGDNE